MQKPSVQIDPSHERRRSFMRFAGVGTLLAGLILTTVGFTSFFMAFGSFEPPRYFWAAFLGIPLIAVGGICTMMGNLGNYYRYLSAEMTPAGQEILRSMAAGSHDAVETVAHAVGRGLAQGMGHPAMASPGVGDAVDCQQCGSKNSAGARFCNQCGGSLGVAPCPACGADVPGTARFCQHCGKPLP